MNVNYEYYRIFYYAANYQSFTRAANVLHSSQPNVTRAIGKLEQALGCALFVRSSQGVTLTPEGEALFRHVAVAQEHLQKGEDELAGCARLESGALSISTSATALGIFLLGRLQLFHDRYPGIRLRLWNHSTPQAITALERGAADLAVVTAPAHTEAPLRETPLQQFQDILIGGPAFAELAQAPLHLRQLAGQPLICLGRETMTYAFYSRLFSRYGLTLQPDTEVATADQILPLVQCNLGLAFVPEPFAREALEQGQVLRLPLLEPIPQRYVGLLRDSRRPLSVAAREFVRILKAGQSAP